MSLTPNEWQNHGYAGGRPNEAGSTHEQSPDFPGQGENPVRQTKKTSEAERHIQSKPGFQVAKERAASVQSNREKTAADFESHRKPANAAFRKASARHRK